MAYRTGISAKKIIKFNEGIQSNSEELESGQMVYLQLKRSSYRGPKLWHKVQEGDNMYKISQVYGLLLEKLYIRNAMAAGDEPVVGERIKLKGGPIPIAPKLIDDISSDLIASNEEGPDLLPALVVNNEKEETADLEMDEEYAPIDIVFEKPEQNTEPMLDPKKEEESKPVFEPSSFPEDPLIEEVDAQKKADKDAGPLKKEDSFPEFYLVRKGDTLWSISRKYDATVDQIKSWNKLASNAIKVGSRLRVK